jgi:hypothetical protein
MCEFECKCLLDAELETMKSFGKVIFHLVLDWSIHGWYDNVVLHCCSNEETGKRQESGNPEVTAA